MRVRWFHGSLFFYFLWHLFTFKIDSAGTSLVEDTCQCLEAKYLTMSKLIKAKKIQWKSSSFSLLWKYCICDISLNHQRLSKKNMKEQLFWKCTCMITSPLVIGICFCYCRYCCASVWAFVSWPKGENCLKLIDGKLVNMPRAQLEL